MCKSHKPVFYSKWNIETYQMLKVRHCNDHEDSSVSVNIWELMLSLVSSSLHDRALHCVCGRYGEPMQ